MCPRCGKVWTIMQGADGTYCDCHLYCDNGSSPKDCSVTAQNYSGKLGWPVGLKQENLDEGSDVRHRTYYCSIHGIYSYKEPVYLEVDWERWKQTKRISARLRETTW